jgi:tRNA 5-methylaminomethyl-2-thiouridine biosynthesis bifunctional protein
MASGTDQARGFTALEPSVLALRDATPWSERYGDVYYSRRRGADESTEVFLRANGLPDRWAHRDLFTVAETGFGTGLNFLLTWDLWRGRPGPGWLHYLSAELHPFMPADMARLVATLPAGLRALGETLVSQYPETIPGFHRLIFPRDRVTLTLLFGDATEGFAQCEARVDAWYLDGFAPARNPGLWHAALYAQMARLTAPGGTLASYTAAGHVRRGLQAAGFHIERRPGFGAKRERIVGRRDTGATLPDARAPWFRWPDAAEPDERHVAVVGAGLAGSALALALARRGWEVTVVDAGPGAASGASGNPAGILMPHLSADHGVLSRFTLQASEFARHWIDSMHVSPDSLPRDWCGALWLADGERLAGRLERIAARLPLPETVMRPVDARQASALAGVPLTLPGLFLPRAGWVDPKALCRAQLSSAGARVLTDMRIERVQRAGGHWHLEDGGGRIVARASRLVLANARGMPELHPGIETRPLRGQLSLLAPSPATRALQRVLCYEGYVTPAMAAGHVCGASFVRGDTGTDLRAEEHAAILAALERVWPGACPGEPPPMTGRAAVRYNAPGRLPLAGPLPNMAEFDRIYGDLHHGRPARDYPDAPCLPGMYASLAHGSRGLTTVPLAAELVASLMHGDPLPLPRDLVEALHPARGRVRALIRSPVRR